jgi:hypothetical protein
MFYYQDEQIQLSNSARLFLSRLERNLQFDFVISSSSGLNVVIDTRTLSDKQINEFLNTIAEIGAIQFTFNPSKQLIIFTVPKRKINIANLGFLILLLRGVTWAMRK